VPARLLGRAGERFLLQRIHGGQREYNSACTCAWLASRETFVMNVLYSDSTGALFPVIYLSLEQLYAILTSVP